MSATERPAAQCFHCEFITVRGLVQLDLPAHIADAVHFHPMSTLRERALRIWRETRGDLSSESVAALLLAPVLLTINRYYCKPNVFRRHVAHLNVYPDFELFAYAYWFISATLALCVVPMIVWAVAFRKSPSELNTRFGSRETSVVVVAAFVPMAVVVALIGTTSAFESKYPMFDGAKDGLRAFLIYELLYGVYFFAWEFFFRGWMLRALAPDFGTRAIWIQTIPFVLMHFGKPFPETLGALPAGLFLGWLSWRSGSFLYGWLLHWGVAFVMDAVIVGRGWLS
ncbi:MAG: type II CAAX endopeptidase family protein [Candidatus Poribacteria bacterium]|nr:type II CAAX endopeptidase family protein [Candidatus Poribacteria bacterium]